MVSQALGNSREPSAATGRMVILLAPSLTLPAELEQDVYMIDEPLPDTEALQAVVAQTFEDVAQDYPSIEEKLTPPVSILASDALTGLSAFAAQQASALSMTPGGIDLDALWERKRQMIDATPGRVLRQDRRGPEHKVLPAGDHHRQAGPQGHRFH